MLRVHIGATARVGRRESVPAIPVVTSSCVVTSDGAGAVVALEKSTLREMWRKEAAGREPRWAIGERVILVSSRGDDECWDERGTLLWARKLGLSTLRVGDELYTRVSPTRIARVELGSGQTLEELEVSPGKPLALAGQRLVLKHQNQVSAFDLVQRRVLWERDLVDDARVQYGIIEDSGSVLAVVPAEDDILVLRRGHWLLGASATDGRLLWAIPAHVPYYWPEVRDGRVWAWVTGARAETLKMLDVDTGVIAVSRSKPVGQNRIVSLDAARGTSLYDRPLVSFDPALGEYQEPQKGALGHANVLYATRSGLLLAFRLSDGELVFKHQHSSQLFSPVISGNHAYVTCANGTVVAFEAEVARL